MLASALTAAYEHVADVQSQIEDLLALLFPGWRPRFPITMGWRFTPPSTIDVYDAVETSGEIAALRSAGFSVVVLHPHSAARFLTCTCRSKEPT
jgi:hypothetical protein